jgi:predicted AAA+ superfamily ATPase
MERIITNIIQNKLKTNKIILLIGQRQIGKTFELLRLHDSFPDALYFDFEDINQARLFAEPAITKLENVIGDKSISRMLFLDEVQLVPKIGSTLKLIHDHFPSIKIVASGSAAFLLLKNIGDSLYGRHIQLEMFPLTVREMISKSDAEFALGGYDKIVNKGKIDACFEQAMIFGSLPKVFLAETNEQKIDLLKNYHSSLLFKDLFELEDVRNPRALKDLLRLLALQIGGEANPNELAEQLSISRSTVLDYIYLLEKFKIIYVIRSYNTNQRNELKKNFKVYFTDLGIRNAVIGNFIALAQRNDIGGIFENLVMNLFRYNISYFNLPLEQYFWRNVHQAEVDMVLHDTEKDELIPIEIKYRKVKSPSSAFVKIYKDKIDKLLSINFENLWQYI